MILVSTVKRSQYVLNENIESYVYAIDWNDKKIIKKIKVPEAKGVAVSNRFSGGRGLTKNGNAVFLANYDSIYIFNFDLELEYYFSSHLFCAIHEISAEHEGVWVTSTHTDSVFFIGPKKSIERSFYLSESEMLINDANLKPQVTYRSIDRNADHRLETYVEPVNELKCAPNSIEKINGNMFVILKFQKVVIQLEPFRIVADISYIQEPHSLTLLKSGKIIILSASDTVVYIYDDSNFRGMCSIDLKKETIDWPIEMSWRLVDGFAQEGWLRGVCELENGNILVGVSPFTLVEIDVSNRMVVDSFNVKQDITVSPFDILEC